MELKNKLPDAVELTQAEEYRITRARVAVLLKMTPEAVEQLPLQDVEDVLWIAQLGGRSLT